MGRVIFIFFIFCFAFISSSKANDSTLQLQLKKSVAGNYKDFEVDNLGNIYLISNSNQIKKIAENLDSIGVFNDSRRYGDISSIDVNNPLKILIFYKDFSTTLILDRFLNVRNSIDLRKQNILQASCVSTSYDNNIWLFDELDSKLKKVDDDGNVLLETVDFRLLFDNDFVPDKIIDTNKKLFLYNKQKGLIVFDYYGAFKKKYAILGLESIQIENDDLIGFNKGRLQYYNLNLLKQTFKNVINKIDFSKKSIFQKNQFYFLSTDGLEIYTSKYL